VDLHSREILAQIIPLSSASPFFFLHHLHPHSSCLIDHDPVKRVTSLATSSNPPFSFIASLAMRWTPCPVPSPPQGQSLSLLFHWHAIYQWDNPHITMKIQTLIPTLAMVLFASVASAQSDPSVGGSFGNSFKSGSGSVEQHRDINASASVTTPTHTSFWSKITGKNKNMMQANTNVQGRTHSWFHRQPASDAKPTGSRSWFGLHRNSNTSGSLQNNTRMSGRARMDSTSSSKPHNWHIPFFSNRQSTHT
jgi:hypothetical protein